MFQRPSPIVSYGLSILCMVLFATSLMSACDRSRRSDTLHASVIALNAARDGWLTWDRSHQLDMVASATTREEAERKVADYQASQHRIATSFEIAYRALALAATQSDQPSFDDAVKRANELLASIHAIMGGP